MRKPLILAAALLGAPALAQTAPADAPAPEAAPPNDNRAAILDDSATTPRSGETDAGATRAPDYRPAGMGGPATRSYPPCTRTRTDQCRQRGGR
ncbi:MAG TPA: hypothetical protein VF718_09350 [Allosphingosinicella sp.]|jgi:hypothetical protein